MLHNHIVYTVPLKNIYTQRNLCKNKGRILYELLEVILNLQAVRRTFPLAEFGYILSVR
jgi:hypothetical protein